MKKLFDTNEDYWKWFEEKSEENFIKDYFGEIKEGEENEQIRI